MKPEEFGKIMDVSDLIAVHLTEYFPVGGIIGTLNTALPGDILRNTVHFAINHPVANVGPYGNWDNKQYAILVPLEALCAVPGNHLWNFNVVDTYFVGDVSLPRGTIILSKSPCHPTQEEFKEMEKKGIRYWISGEDLRTDAYNVILKQGYEAMPGGQWNWGVNGARQEDQERIASMLGVKHGVHSCDGLSYLEMQSASLSRIACDNFNRNLILRFLETTGNGQIEIAPELFDSESPVHDGRRVLKEIPSLVSYFEQRKEQLPPDFKPRIDRFLTINRGRLRSFIPQEVIEMYQLPI